MISDAEDEAFNEIERKSKVKQTLVKASTNPYRNQIIEEVAQHVEKLGSIVAGNLGMYIREMKE
jgi:hypothetical protein